MIHVLSFLLAQRRADGGFLEVRVAKRSGTNTTAAAIGCTANARSSDTRGIGDGGGILGKHSNRRRGISSQYANAFTRSFEHVYGRVTLWDLGFLEEIDVQAAFRYGMSMARAEGGFAGFELDPAEDVEYTFYGLGLLSLLKPWVS